MKSWSNFGAIYGAIRNYFWKTQGELKIYIQKGSFNKIELRQYEDITRENIINML